MSELKYNETGSAPYYLNFSNTAKDFSNDDRTNPQYGLLELLSKNVFLQNEVQIQEDFIIVNDVITSY